MQGNADQLAHVTTLSGPVGRAVIVPVLMQPASNHVLQQALADRNGGTAGTAGGRLVNLTATSSSSEAGAVSTVLQSTSAAGLD
jgi:hypothetical protein